MTVAVSTDLQEFIRAFGVPEVALSCLDRMVTSEEILLVLAGGRGPLTLESAQQALGLTAEEAAAALDRAFRRAVLDRTEQGDHTVYTPTDFYTWLDIFATFDESWSALPPEARRALDEWMLQEYIARVRPNVERLMAGELPQGSPGNDSVVLLEELDRIVDAATTIAVFPCDCRKLGGNCNRPVETCLQFNAMAEKKLTRGYGRRLTAGEAKELLAWADRKGLMHTTDLEFGADGPSPICNCCADDCYVFRAAGRLGSKGGWPRSRYVAAYDPQACLMCGACALRCQFGAFYRSDDTVEVAGLEVRQVAFDPARCWGCGLCASICPTDAITLMPLA